MTCEQCGRTGTRMFRVYPADVATGRPELVVCSKLPACRRRRWRNLTPEARAEIMDRDFG